MTVGEPVHGLRHRPEHFAAVPVRLRTEGTGAVRKLASRRTDVREGRSGHFPFAGRPELIADLVRELRPDSRVPPSRDVPA